MKKYQTRADFEHYYQLEMDLGFRSCFLFCGTDMIDFLFQTTPAEFVQTYRMDNDRYWNYYFQLIFDKKTQQRFDDYCMKRRNGVLQ